MADVVSMRCKHPDGCSKHPNFGPPGGTASRCLAHSEPGMVNLKNMIVQKCAHPGGCSKRPSFGLPGGPASRCSGHQEPGMVNLYDKLCNHPGGCSLHPSYGLPGASVSRCAAHKDPGMFSLKQWKILVRKAAEAVAEEDQPQPAAKRRRNKVAAGHGRAQHAAEEQHNGTLNDADPGEIGASGQQDEQGGSGQMGQQGGRNDAGAQWQWLDQGDDGVTEQQRLLDQGDLGIWQVFSRQQAGPGRQGGLRRLA